MVPPTPYTVPLCDDFPHVLVQPRDIILFFGGEERGVTETRSDASKFYSIIRGRHWAQKVKPDCTLDGAVNSDFSEKLIKALI